MEVGFIAPQSVHHDVDISKLQPNDCNEGFAFTQAVLQATAEAHLMCVSAAGVINALQ